MELLEHTLERVNRSEQWTNDPCFRSATEPSQDVPGAAPTILVAGDEEQSEWLKWAFERIAPEVTVVFARDGAEVIDYLQDGSLEVPSKPAMLLLNTRMAVMDGFQVLQWLGMFPEFRPAHVFIMQGSEATPEDGDRAWLMGVDGCLAKPLAFDDVCEQAKELQALVLARRDAAETAFGEAQGFPRDKISNARSC